VTLPRELAALPESEQIREAFGWLPATWAFGLLVYCSLLFIQPAKAGFIEYLVVTLVAALALWLIVFEFRRRRQPRVMARSPQNLDIGIYKRGVLERSVNVEDVKLFLLHPGRTWGAILLLAALSLAFAVFVMPGPGALSTRDRVLAALASLFFASLAASTIKTRLFCDQCLFPYVNARRQERIMVPRKSIPQLLSRPTKADAATV
jgi:hypothetical protein